MSNGNWTPKAGTRVVVAMRAGDAVEGRIVAIDRAGNGDWYTVEYKQAGVKRSTRCRFAQLSKPVREAA